jgi:hypothetical protein
MQKQKVTVVAGKSDSVQQKASAVATQITPGSGAVVKLVKKTDATEGVDNVSRSPEVEADMPR